jgi:hypothetical protein
MMRTMAQDSFGRALSLAVPNTSVPYSRVYELAVDVVKRGRFDAGEARRLLAMDSSADPLKAALDELEETLSRIDCSARDKQAIFDMCTQIASARDSASAPQRGMEMLEARSPATSGAGPNPSTAGLNKNDWPSDVPSPFSTTVRKVPTGPGNAVDRRRGHAADERPGPLDALFAEFPPAARPLG